MPLFEFELKPVKEIGPWENEGKEHLNWYALSDGSFRIRAGNQVLFRYTEDILRHWQANQQDVDYPIAQIARDILGSSGPASASLPDFFESIGSNWSCLSAFKKSSRDHEDYYEAFRWLGERSPDTGYFAACPNVSFYRIKDDIVVAWDNRDKVVDGIPVWRAQTGSILLPVYDFKRECREFLMRFLGEMELRIQQIDSGVATPQVPVSCEELLKQHETWTTELSSYLEIQNKPDIPWDQAEITARKLLLEFETKFETE